MNQDQMMKLGLDKKHHNYWRHNVEQFPDISPRANS